MSDQSYDCPVCGTGMARLAHCKLRCPNCGLTEDCTDLFAGSALAGRPMPRRRAPAPPSARTASRPGPGRILSPVFEESIHHGGTEHTEKTRRA